MVSNVIIPNQTTITIQNKRDKKVCSNIQLGIIQPCLQSVLSNGVSVTPALIDGSTQIHYGLRSTTYFRDMWQLLAMPYCVEYSHASWNLILKHLVSIPQVMIAFLNENSFIVIQLT